MELWLTRITPNPRSAEARADLATAGNLHRRLMRLLPPEDLGDSPRRAAGLLFRVEESRQGTAVVAQSARKLDPVRLPHGYGQVEHRELSPLLDSLATGQPVRYRIVASPTKRVGRSAHHGLKETTTPLRGPEAEAWWRSRARDNGLEPRSLITHDRADAVDNSRGRRIRHAAVMFQGVAEVTDVAAAREAVHRGIGRGKSHGCGLLSLAPLGGGE
ncbi:type I-E CRISPR-associated protein Cas6/Cse3/CasE [Halostreptopolyspora alba]|uniref:Type I-E CRISPR-associated protein Cas6/Cse3/CasE n=1 Tax=Halostreptopolyspora alba TaxID=2487137 RepID=A0A3N0EFZ7_9ACTN|nr:type I-E CRISPR-associated protein Cas6/Cse3/CasE [Nocardiopsaceae bacterium YIM 96095]